jgi:hypothetical protein
VELCLHSPVRHIGLTFKQGLLFHNIVFSLPFSFSFLVDFIEDYEANVSSIHVPVNQAVISFLPFFELCVSNTLFHNILPILYPVGGKCSELETEVNI